MLSNCCVYFAINYIAKAKCWTFVTRLCLVKLNELINIQKLFAQRIARTQVHVREEQHDYIPERRLDDALARQPDAEVGIVVQVAS